MERKEFIKNVIDFIADKARTLNLNDIEYGEDRQKGFWGEKLTEFLEKLNGGDCSSEITFRDENDKDRRAWFRYRFDSPCIGLKWYEGSYECLVEFEFSNYVFVDVGIYEEDTLCHKKGDVIHERQIVDWRIAQVTMFNENLSGGIYREWHDEINDKILKGQRNENK